MPISIKVPETVLVDEGAMRRIKVPETTIELEHSLHSMRQWEAKWKKPFLSPLPRTPEESLDYIRCMTLTPGVSEYAYQLIKAEDIKRIQDYIDDPMTASRFRGEEPTDSKNGPKGKGGSRVNTAHKLYAAMATFGIPFECEWWHLNELLDVIHHCELMNSGGKMSKKDSAMWMKATNEARKAKYGTKG